MLNRSLQYTVCYIRNLRSRRHINILLLVHNRRFQNTEYSLYLQYYKWKENYQKTEDFQYHEHRNYYILHWTLHLQGTSLARTLNKSLNRLGACALLNHDCTHISVREVGPNFDYMYQGYYMFLHYRTFHNAQIYLLVKGLCQCGVNNLPGNLRNYQMFHNM